jgi:hypothetical protein
MKDIKEGFAVVLNKLTPSPAPTTPGPTAPPDPYAPTNPLPLPFVPLDSNGQPVNASGPNSGQAFQDAIASNLATIPTPAPGKSDSCPKPPEFSYDDIFQKAGDIAKQTGGDTDCIKNQSNSSKTNASALSIKGQASAPFVSASFGAAASHSETQQAQQMSEAGCGSLMITATNVSSKQAQMQCIINNVTQNVSASVNVNQQITIETSELSADVKAQLASATANTQKTIADLAAAVNKAIIDGRNDCITTCYNAGITDTTQINKLCNSVDTPAILAFNERAAKLIKDANQSLIDNYSRSISIEGGAIRNTSSTSLKASVSLSVEQQNQISAISQSITKDVTSQTLANTFGVAVTDPNVKQASNTAMANTSSSASSSITNIMSNTNIQSNGSQGIKIFCPGKIDLKNVIIDQNLIATVVASAILSQSVTNGIQAAASYVSDTTNTKSIANKVSGLDDLQAALGKTNADAIRETGNAADVNSSSSSIVMYIVLGVVLLVAFYMFSGKSSDSQPMIVMPSLK